MHTLLAWFRPRRKEALDVSSNDNDLLACIMVVVEERTRVGVPPLVLPTTTDCWLEETAAVAAAATEELWFVETMLQDQPTDELRWEGGGAAVVDTRLEQGGVLHDWVRPVTVEGPQANWWESDQREE